MRTIAGIKMMAVRGALLAATAVLMVPTMSGAQGYGDRNQNQNHGMQGQGNQGHDDHGMQQGHDNHGMNNQNNNNFRFRDDDRGRFTSHYQKDAQRWRGRKRPNFTPGQHIPTTYRVQPVPRSYWRGAAAPPPGYQYGYYDGYVVAYNPTTRIIADVMDLVGAAVNH